MAGRSDIRPRRAAPLRLIAAWLAEHPTLAYWLKILRLGLFQFGMGLSLAPITGTLNRVLIDEMRIPAVAVGVLIAIHYFISPIRAIIGHRSDTRRASGHWRTPMIMFGAMLTFGGLTCAPFALILLSGKGMLPFWPAFLACFGIFLIYGVGVNIVETMYLALVSDITVPRLRGQVVAVLWAMLVLGTVVGSIGLGQLLVNYSSYRLIQVMQGSAIVFVFLAFAALMGQERLKSNGQLAADVEDLRVRLSLGASLRLLAGERLLRALFGVLFVATVAFAAHDVLLEPYGGQVLGMSVAATTQLTAIWGVLMIVGVACAGLWLWRGNSPVALIGAGALVGALGFTIISLAGGPGLVAVFQAGVGLIGMGRGLFIVGSVALVMSLADSAHTGLFLALWGMMQSLAQGFGVIGGGLLRDLARTTGGSELAGYTTVYAVSVGMLVLALAAMLALRLGRRISEGAVRSPWAGLKDIPADQLLS